MSIAYIGLGSNLDLPEQQLKTAIDAIQKIPHTTLIRCSQFYVTKPWGEVQNQPDFHNAVVALETALSPYALLEALQKVEQDQNRIRMIKNGPRTLDCDLLLYDNAVINEPPLLIVPHPRMKERAFVLVPLAEIAPDLILPQGEQIQDLLLECQ